MNKTPCKLHYSIFREDCEDCKKATIYMNEVDKLQENGNYIYVEGTTPENLVMDVNKKIEKGYVPLGSPNIIVTPTWWKCFQFMVKAKKKSN